MFQKHISDLNKDDIQRIVDTAVQEDAEVEFKETLPAKKGRKDSWMDGGNNIDDRARNDILEEIIAFANTYGGTLILGIKETSNKPARAHSICPIPRCTELAERLKLQCRDCVEPQIPIIDISGVLTEERTDAGVVVVQLPQSRSGPHRLTSNKECYKRHSDRTERMSMREIQDLTLNLERGLSAIETKFSRRAEEFSDSAGRFFTPPRKGFGFRLTLIPLSPIHLDRVHNVGDVRPPEQNFVGQRGGRQIELICPSSSDLRWRPIVRGSRGTMTNENLLVTIEVMRDGIIQYSYLHVPTDPNSIYMSWLLASVCNSLIAAEQFRRSGGVHAVEYGLDMEFYSVGSECLIKGYADHYSSAWVGRIPEGRPQFPRYSVGSPSEFPMLLSELEQDLWHAAGRDPGDDERIVVDFTKALG